MKSEALAVLKGLDFTTKSIEEVAGLDKLITKESDAPSLVLIKLEAKAILGFPVVNVADCVVTIALLLKSSTVFGNNET